MTDRLDAITKALDDASGEPYCMKHCSSDFAIVNDMRWLAAEVRRLKALLDLFLIDCNNLHHTRSERHDVGQTCPVEAKIRAALEGER